MRGRQAVRRRIFLSALALIPISTMSGEPAETLQQKARRLADQFIIEFARKEDPAADAEYVRQGEKAAKQAEEAGDSKRAASIRETLEQTRGRNKYQAVWVQTEDRGDDIVVTYRLTRPYTVSSSDQVILAYDKATGVIRVLARGDARRL